MTPNQITMLIILIGLPDLLDTDRSQCFHSAASPFALVEQRVEAEHLR